MAGTRSSSSTSSSLTSLPCLRSNRSNQVVDPILLLPQPVHQGLLRKFRTCFPRPSSYF